MKYFLTPSLLAWTLAAATPSLPAADFGDPAAPLLLSEWIQGTPITLEQARGQKILVVEFWATWCPPCRTSIPHLTALQKKYRDRGVLIIGITDEAPAVVRPFVQKMGDQMDYAVAIDQDRQTSGGYMRAFRQGGIPHAFIVDRSGRVVWHGHPMTQLEQTLEEVIAGTLDLDKVRKRAQAESLLQEYRQALLTGQNEDRSRQLARELETLDQELGGIQPGRKFDPEAIRSQVRFSQALRDYQRAFANENPAPDRLAALEQTLAQEAPPGFQLESFKERLAVQRKMQDYLRQARALFEAGQIQQAVELQQKAVALAGDDPSREAHAATLQRYQAALPQ